MAGKTNLYSYCREGAQTEKFSAIRSSSVDLHISGVWPCHTDVIVNQMRLNSDMDAHDLTEENNKKIAAVISENLWRINGDLGRKITLNLRPLPVTGIYQPIRHYCGLSFCDQKISTNTHTKKGAQKTIGVIGKHESMAVKFESKSVP
jgi:small subunit ribosomal protein S13